MNRSANFQNFDAITQLLFFAKNLPYLLLFFALPNLVNAAKTETDSSDTITGAGAHFAWVIFDSLKEELEIKSGKKLRLFGENSNLGMGCSAGIKLAKQSTAKNQTFGFICCPLNEQEINKEKIKVYPLAEEPILILVNKNNPIKNLSTEQVRSIFRGDTSNWKTVGGWDKPIIVVTRLHCKQRPGHWKTILPDANSFVKKRLDVSSAEEMVKLVTDFDTSIGHTGSTWKFNKNSHVKAITINNIKASAKSLKDKSYPFHRRISAITNLNPSATVLSTIRQVQHGKSFKSVAERFNLLPLNSTDTE